jgi:GNAT superfamily N-acetyltransferase
VSRSGDPGAVAPAILTLERAALAAWPAEEEEALAGWRLRAMRGVTRRANSVWTAEAGEPLPIDQRVARAEAFYARRGLPCVVQVSTASVPAGLDAALAARGYTPEAAVSVQVAPSGAVAARADVDVSVRVEPSPSPAWLAISAGQGRFAAVQPIYRGLLSRLGARAVYALAEHDGQPASVGLGVHGGDGCFGVFSMLTLPPARRRGLGYAVLVALARAASSAGARWLYLQVEEDNAPARALYAQLGFVERYGYHYRRAPGVPP